MNNIETLQVFYYQKRETFYEVVDKPWFLALQIVVQIPVIVLAWSGIGFG